jgi:predicted DNA-binding transcriptional regulator AlpA
VGLFFNNTRGKTVMSNIDYLPATGYVRLPQIIGDPNSNPPIPAVYPVSRSTWWAGVKTGKFPPSIKLGVRTTAWRVEDIQALIRGEYHNDIGGGL